MFSVYLLSLKLTLFVCFLPFSFVPLFNDWLRPSNFKQDFSGVLWLVLFLYKLIFLGIDLLFSSVSFGSHCDGLKILSFFKYFPSPFKVNAFLVSMEAMALFRRCGCFFFSSNSRFHDGTTSSCSQRDMGCEWDVCSPFLKIFYVYQDISQGFIVRLLTYEKIQDINSMYLLPSTDRKFVQFLDLFPKCMNILINMSRNTDTRYQKTL